MKRTVLVLISLWMASFSLSCNKSSPPEKPVIPAERTQGITLNRFSQRTIRYNCQGEVISDQLELVSTPREWISLLPQQRKNFYRLVVNNEANNSTLTIGHFGFWLDASNESESLEVKDGMNTLDYAFTYCDQLSNDEEKPTECATAPYTLEKGSLLLNITYKDQTLAYVEKIHPRKQDCRH